MANTNDSFDVPLEKLRWRCPRQFAEPRLSSYLERVQTFLLNTLARWQDREPWPQFEPPAFLECQANVLVDNSATAGAPVIIETAPRYNNLFGAIGRRQNRDGAWHSDFTQIKTGALARANGGYLFINLSDALGKPGVRRMLKRALRHHRLAINTHDPLTLNPTATLRPEPVPLNNPTRISMATARRLSKFAPSFVNKILAHRNKNFYASED